MNAKERVEECFKKIREAISSKREDVPENLSITKMAEEIRKIDNGLEINNGTINEKYTGLFNDSIEPGNFVKIVNGYKYQIERKKNVNLYSCCTTNLKSIAQLYTDKDDNLIFELNNNRYYLNKQIEYYIELKQVKIKENIINFIFNADHFYYEIEINIKTKELNVIKEQQGKIIKINDFQTIIRDNDLYTIYNQDTNILLTDITSLSFDNENNVGYIKNNNQLYFNNNLILDNLDNGIIKAIFKKDERLWCIYYENMGLLYQGVIRDEKLDHIQVIPLDINTTYNYQIYSLDNKVGFLYQSYLNNVLYFTISSNEEYNEGYLAKDLSTYEVLYQDADKLILLLDNRTITTFNLREGAMYATSAIKAGDYINGICISNPKLMIGNQVRILCPKEEK